MSNAKAIEALHQLGLTQYEAKVYLALQGEDAAPASRLQRKSGVPSGGVYTALDALLERGFAELVLGTKKTFRCIPVEQALRNHQHQLDQQIETMKAESELKLANARSVLENIAATDHEPAKDPSSLGIRLVASRNSPDLHKELFATDEEVLVCIPVPAFPRGSDAEARASRIKRKQTRFIVDSAVLEDAEIAERSLEYAEAIGNVRFASELPLRFTVFDRKLVLLELVEPDESWQLLVIPNEQMAQKLAATFEEIWQRAKPAQEIRPDQQNRAGA